MAESLTFESILHPERITLSISESETSRVTASAWRALPQRSPPCRPTVPDDISKRLHSVFFHDGKTVWREETPACTGGRDTLSILA